MTLRAASAAAVRVTLRTSGSQSAPQAGDTITVVPPPGTDLANIQGYIDKGAGKVPISGFTGLTYQLTGSEIPPLGVVWPITVMAQIADVFTDNFNVTTAIDPTVTYFRQTFDVVDNSTSTGGGRALMFATKRLFYTLKNPTAEDIEFVTYPWPNYDINLVSRGAVWQTLSKTAGSNQLLVTGAEAQSQLWIRPRHYTVSSITSTGTTVTVTTPAAHGRTTGDLVTVNKVAPTGYNVANVAITVTGSTTFTYTMPASQGVVTSNNATHYYCFQPTATAGIEAKVSFV